MEVPVTVTTQASPAPARQSAQRTTSSERCRVIRETFDRLGDKWSLLLVSILSNGPLRFTTLMHAAEGISQRMLTHTLRKLERDGLVQRTVYAEVPPRVEYALTDLGLTLVGPITALADWAVTHETTLQSSQTRFDARRNS
jgi:DNA-binding HxlR family transcriptional regulator